MAGTVAQVPSVSGLNGLPLICVQHLPGRDDMDDDTLILLGKLKIGISWAVGPLTLMAWTQRS